MPIYSDPACFLLSGASAGGPGPTAIDGRAVKPYGYLFYQASAQSGVFSVQASHDRTAWLTVATYTATATQTGTAQLSGHYPYLRATVDALYSGAGKTGMLWAYYAPGLA